MGAMIDPVKIAREWLTDPGVCNCGEPDCPETAMRVVAQVVLAADALDVQHGLHCPCWLSVESPVDYDELRMWLAKCDCGLVALDAALKGEK